MLLLSLVSSFFLKAENSSLLIYLTVIVKHTWWKEVGECNKCESNIKLGIAKKADKEAKAQKG